MKSSKYISPPPNTPPPPIYISPRISKIFFEAQHKPRCACLRSVQHLKSGHLSLMSIYRDGLCPDWKWSLWTVYFLRFSSTSLRIFFSRLDVSYSFSISYSLHGSAHFCACSICSGVKYRSKRIPLMSNLGRSQRLDHGFGFIFTFNYKTRKKHKKYFKFGG